MLNEQELERFRAKIKKVPGPLPSRCWEWQAGKNNKGYGQFAMLRLFGGMKSAHRVSLAHYRGFDIESSECVLHKCDTPLCCNPSHLFIGSQADNMLDMNTKGRRGKTGAVGSRQHSAKLTEKEVLQIRDLDGWIPRKQIQEDYNISKYIVSKVILRKTWKHI